MKTNHIVQLILILGFLNCTSPDYNLGYRETIADLAFSSNLYAIQRELNSGANINERDTFQKKFTALMVAAREGDLELAKYLVQKGADVNAVTRDGHTALMYACYNRFPEIVKLLVENGADVNQKSSQGHTAISEASLEHSKEIISYLKLKGANQ
ncbi:MAG: ankyrin repeat domain-containing protein [Leptospiraceae bacterium]|nr:ankyrin repeat domain-containing protein [Leptospiraceae bacterium]